MRDPEDHGLPDYGDKGAPAQGCKLLLEVSSEDRFLADSRRHGQENPDRDLERPSWQERGNPLRAVTSQGVFNKHLDAGPRRPDREGDREKDRDQNDRMPQGGR